MALIFHWGGPRHGHVAEVPDRLLTSSLLVYDGPEWIGVYERLEPTKHHHSERGAAEVWVVRE